MRISYFMVLLIMGRTIFAFSQDKNSNSSFILGVLSSIDSIASSQQDNIENDYVTVYFDSPANDSLPTSIISMVKTFYSSPSEQTNQEDVLGFLTNVYSEHDFHESGNWAKEPTKNIRYIPFKGELPDYSLKEFVLPASGFLTSSYGYRPTRNKYHHGIDVAVKTGDSIKCALPGIVTKIGFEKTGYGHYVVVAHSGDVETIYAHLKAPLTSPGEKVMAGDIIGLGGFSGNSTGPHLHFETRYRGMPVNPFSWFDLTGIK